MTDSLATQIHAIVEPQLQRPIGELGFVDDVSASAVALVLPVTNWPQYDYLVAAIEAIAPGASVTARTMSDD